MGKIDRNVITNALKSLGDCRDALIISASFVYVVGYGIWSLSAYRLNLGLLPAVDLNYFLAGLAPAISFIGALGLFSVAEQLRERLENLPEEVSTQRAIVRALVIVASLALFVYLIATHDSVVGIFVSEESEFAISCVGVFFLVLYLFPPVSRKAKFSNPILYGLTEASIGSPAFLSIYRKFTSIALGLFLISIVAFGWVLILPKVPQALGGIKSRCAYFEIKTDDFTAQMHRKLVTSPITVEANKKVVRTGRLEVIAVIGGRHMVRVDKLKNAYPLEIPSASIFTIDWTQCE